MRVFLEHKSIFRGTKIFLGCEEGSEVIRHKGTKAFVGVTRVFSKYESMSSY